MIENPWLHEYEILRNNNLVYLRTLKCASSYYSMCFKSFGWQQSTANTIDWQNDHVFSFIMEPQQRRLKGLTEFVVANCRQELLGQDQLFWGGVLYLDMHSVPYSTSYRPHVDKIDWIPLDWHTGDGIIDQQLSLRMLVSLLSSYNLEYKFPQEKIHQSDSNKLKIYKHIKQIAENDSYAVHLGMLEDIDLYNRVCTQVSPWLLDSHDWSSVSWLK